MNILQINTTYNSGSTGRIVFQIGQRIESLGWKSYVAYGRGSNVFRQPRLFKIGTKLDFIIHVLLTRIFDLHGHGSILSTKRLIKFIEVNQIDIIHLHNIHGYYLNLEYLFNYLKGVKKPVVWTLHDCWAFTGHCAHFVSVNCDKWKTCCNNCPQLKSYPASFFLDNSHFNYMFKRSLFTSISSLTLVPVSKWLEDILAESFFVNANVKSIRNGIDLECFNIYRSIPDSIYSKIIKGKKIVLGVANIWTTQKGYYDFISLSKIISSEFQLVMIGVNEKQLYSLPQNIIGIKKTENLDELVWWYKNSLVLYNPTYEDTYPTVNLESIACGTPVITYNTGGSPESITSNTGFVVKKGDLSAVVQCIEAISCKNQNILRHSCREFAEAKFSHFDCLEKYVALYKNLVQ